MARWAWRQPGIHCVHHAAEAAAIDDARALKRAVAAGAAYIGGRGQAQDGPESSTAANSFLMLSRCILRPHQALQHVARDKRLGPANKKNPRRDDRERG
jgi:hypothetical protein